MVTNSNLIHYKSKDDYRSGVKPLKDSAAKQAAEPAKELAPKEATPVEDKVEISKKAKDSVGEITKQAASASLSADMLSIGVAGKHLAADAAVTLAKSITGTEAKEASEVKEIDVALPIEKPALYFIEGLHLSTLNSKGGLEDLAKSFQNGEFVSWQDEDKVFEEILRRPEDQPIVLVGHSLGGDAVVNLANRLNSLEAGFKKVDLLVTLDSVGFDNDIIPNNVEKNLNFLLESSMIFNDGPNMARDHRATDVVNILRPEGHTKIDESLEVHREIYNEVTNLLDNNYIGKRKQELTDLFNAYISNKT